MIWFAYTWLRSKARGMTRFSNPWGLQVICMRPDRGAPPPSRGLWHHWSTDHVRVATIDTYLHVACLCFCPDSTMVCSHGALSGVWMLLLLRRCSRDAQILAAGAATRRPSRRTEQTDGRFARRDASCFFRVVVVSWKEGKRELPQHPTPFLGGVKKRSFF